MSTGQVPENALQPEVYERLRQLAHRYLGGQSGHTLNTTALVHEAYLKLVGPREVPWQNRAHFFVAAAESMRLILLEHARLRDEERRPVVVELPDGSESIAIHSVGNLTLSWDHRAFDGAYAAAFVSRIKEILETRDWSTEL